MPKRRKADEEDPAAMLTFQQAQTALELTLAQLQSSDLDVEQMALLYQQATRFADRCEQVLASVEQDVMQWDPQHPDVPPAPAQP
ncbi:MAG: exodeoxyribonuclease VII small subunit [Cyanobacteriota bacterium]|jgi:exodeoxyribonuclease VII small subunit|nr:exodeoxyribonuclease VII small subunit [Cyanobacteriota bacterium]